MTNGMTNVTVNVWNLHKMENLEISRGCFESGKFVISYVFMVVKFRINIYKIKCLLKSNPF